MLAHTGIPSASFTLPRRVSCVITTVDCSGVQQTEPPQGQKGILALTMGQLQLSGARHIRGKKEKEQMTGKMRKEGI